MIKTEVLCCHERSLIVIPYCSSVSELINIILFKYFDKYHSAICVDPDRRLQNVASDQALHCFPLILQILDASPGRQIDLFKF